MIVEVLSSQLLPMVVDRTGRNEDKHGARLRTGLAASA